MSGLSFHFCFALVALIQLAVSLFLVSALTHLHKVLIKKAG